MALYPLFNSGGHVLVTNSIFYNNGDNYEIDFFPNSEGTGAYFDISYSKIDGDQINFNPFAANHILCDLT